MELGSTMRERAFTAESVCSAPASAQERVSLVRARVANGNEAVAWAAAAAGVRYFSHYPGSPVNLVEPTLKRISKDRGAAIVFNDALNEHVAALAAAGASFSGVRSLLVMKHVGLNVAADPLNYIGYTGVKGGMVVVVGTDPGANASTGEEDVHWYVPMMNLPLYEPASPGDAYRAVLEAFDTSERHQLPVLVFLPVRLCYGSEVIEVADPSAGPTKKPHFEKDKDRYINVGERACRNHRRLVEKIEAMGREPGRCRTFFNPDAKTGVITRGLTFGHVYESVERLGLEQRVHLLQMDLVYPLPRRTVLEFLRGKEEAIVIEDQDGFLENQIASSLFNDVDCRIDGKKHFPSVGEIGFAQVHAFLSGKFGVQPEPAPPTWPATQIPERLGAFCEGCSHRGAYYAIETALEGRDGIVGGDIGCSSLPPFHADWLMCMNAGIGVAQGMAQVLDEQVVVSTGGDGSFFHAGLISLQSAVQNGINLIHVVFDNGFVAMTGHQASPTTGRRFDHHALLKAIGVHRVIDASASKPSVLAAKLRAELGRGGVRVFWIEGECSRRPSAFRTFLRKTRKLTIDHRACGSCTLCYDRFGCPAIERVQPGSSDLFIDAERCARCGTCLDVCPRGAISTRFACSTGDVLRHAFEYVRQTLAEGGRGVA